MSAATGPATAAVPRTRRVVRPAWLDSTVGLGITVRRLIGGYTVALVLLNAGNAYAIAQRPWLDATQEERGWLLLALESNPSTWFSAVALLGAAAAVLLVAATHPAGSVERRRWLQLAAVPVVLSLDEVSELHERLPLLGAPGGGSGLLYYSWVIPGAVVLGLLALAFGGFVLRQGRYVRRLLAGAAAVTIGGGVVVEAFNGLLDERGTAAWIYQVSTTVEENLELLGVAIVTVGLVHLAARRGLRLAAHHSPEAAASGSITLRSPARAAVDETS